ncbi:MAG: undecaprenyldiphospho-muramoylpentapeptide beta-N-acetylglucosaminyltransferase [Candidatus Omnitrophica bacterium]|nr:undecaprenyldiphospho-muramoylpentapeptide beta-N-acetylglucosaminyltransferase [Candidatus Omnitrophota bacterium]
MVNHKKILIATGGTGGHIYPAMETAGELVRRGWEVRFIGSFGAAGEKLTARGFSHIDIKARGFVSRSPWQKFLALVFLLRAFVRCVREVVTFKPGVVLGFGGYSSFPAVIAGRFLGVRTMIHEQNASPGLANRVLARFVGKIAVSFRDTGNFFPKDKIVWTGYPVRPLGACRSREEILREHGFDDRRKTILVFGGSQGSRAINECVVSCFERFNAAEPLQVIHLAGRGGAERLKARYARLSFPVLLQDYADNMSELYALADVVIARAGAGTVTELGLLGLISILIPYPYANSHQEANARVLAQHEAAVIIKEKDLNPGMLGDKIFLALGSVARREFLRQKLSQDVLLDAVARVSDEVERL